nr:leucine zipper domain-containing protein [Rathayibacter tanaceti]
MSHANARLTVHGRLLLVSRVLDDRRPVAHVAKEPGVSKEFGVSPFFVDGQKGPASSRSCRGSRLRATPTDGKRGRSSAGIRLPPRESAVVERRHFLRGHGCPVSDRSHRGEPCFGGVRGESLSGGPGRSRSSRIRC